MKYQKWFSVSMFLLLFGAGCATYIPEPTDNEPMNGCVVKYINYNGERVRTEDRVIVYGEYEHDTNSWKVVFPGSGIYKWLPIEKVKIFFFGCKSVPSGPLVKDNFIKERREDGSEKNSAMHRGRG